MGFSSLVRQSFIPLIGCVSIGLLEGQTPITDVNATPVPENRSAPLSELFDKQPSVADGLLESNASLAESDAGAFTPSPKSAPPEDSQPAPTLKPTPDSKVAELVEAQAVGVQELVEVDGSPSGELATESENKIQIAINGGMRTYRSSNVTRVSGPKQPAATAFEVSTGANAVFPKVNLDSSLISFTPTVTVMAQRAYFGRYKLGAKDWGKQDARILDYEFRLASFAAEFSAKDDWIITLTAEYDELRNFYQGSKLYHAFVPSVGISKIIPLRKDLALMLDTRLRYAISKTVLQYELPGVFDDDGDNLQTSFNLSLMRSMGEDGKLLLMPSVGFGRTGYLKNVATGRTDYLLLAGMSASYQLKAWLSLQAFANFSHKFTNEKGEIQLGAAASFDNWDIGIALSGNHAF
ncbi:MAG: hypothetical protein HN727_00650 [Opitutae bacterium]|nr:hypothetical protein [Opitutae bacterium]